MREVAKRVFAKEYADSNLVVRDGNTEYAPSYVITPTGAKCNRLYVSGVITEIEKMGDDESYRARISDPTGQFLVFAGEYQPEAARFLAEAETPSFVTIYGKTNVYRPDEETVITSIRPESINYCKEIDRDRWIVKTAKQTLKRLQNIDQKTKQHYNTNTEKYQKMTQKALEITIGIEQPKKETAQPQQETKPQKTEPHTSGEAIDLEEPDKEPEDFFNQPKKTEEPSGDLAGSNEIEDELEESEDDFLEEIISGGKKDDKKKDDDKKDESGDIEEWDLSVD
ncbi:RPA family protein a subunit of RPA complex [Methanonatronarchaeum thermophilum]|uniref:RPA family protein a subunit of RPA complex n=1 Tax=Methanonatronarchaeum thermophilum TaxID=1927129 RepID=A0A1Y3GH74_9EURY|nr:hypothetical protein [Methanonatronarchaeum thermophilum]OUJ18726.1 RPA family protein a subunit of RPA complex [Methanonatronarchaeum thermophilum]